MGFDSVKYNRRSIRLKDYDYSQAGAYYVTMVAQNRECLFGNIANAEMQLNDAGEVSRAEWIALPQRFPNVELDEFVIMPNHVHGIVVITDEERGVMRRGEVSSPSMLGGATPSISGEATPLISGGATPPQPMRPTLGQIIAYFKYQTTKTINQSRDSAGTRIWQRNYYEHIIRNEKDLDRIRKYIFG